MTVESYPSSDGGSAAQTPIPIGVEAGGQSTSPSGIDDSGSPSPLNQEAGGRGLLFLWIGFLATFLVFLTSVIGSIILFTRRNES